MNILRRRTFAEWFGKHILFTALVLTGTYACALPRPPKPDTPAIVQWTALTPTILNAQLTQQAGRTCCQSSQSISASAQLQYSDTRSGISFRYPRGFALKIGDLGGQDTGIGYLGPIPMEFVGRGGVRVVTVEPPLVSYPGTDYVNAFFTLSIEVNDNAEDRGGV